MSFDSLKQYKFFQLPPQVLSAAFIVLIMASALSYSLADTWGSREDYTFGYLMPVFALYILYERWDKIFAYFKTPSDLNGKGSLFYGLCGLFFGLMFLGGIFSYLLFAVLHIITGGKTGAVFPMTIGFSFSFFAMAYFASEKNGSGQKMALRQRAAFVSLFVFPAFAWIISAPTFSAIETYISLFLLSKVAYVVVGVMDFFGYFVELFGNTIRFPNGESVGVADACSGIRSLTACLFAGSFLAAVFLDKLWKKVALVVMSMVLAFFNNLLRALFLAVWAYENGSDSISGFVHDAAGYFVLGMTVLGLMILLPLFLLNPVPKEVRNADGTKE